MWSINWNAHFQANTVTQSFLSCSILLVLHDFVVFQIFHFFFETTFAMLVECSVGHKTLAPNIFQRATNFEEIAYIWVPKYKYSSREMPETLGGLPINWRTATLPSFFKSGDRSNCSNYRSMGLIDVARKRHRASKHKEISKTAFLSAASVEDVPTLARHSIFGEYQSNAGAISNPPLPASLASQWHFTQLTVGHCG